MALSTIGDRLWHSTAAGTEFLLMSLLITLIPIIMQFIAGTPVGIISDAHQIIEIKLWETYLLNDRSNLNAMLNHFAIDHGPVENAHHEPGRIIYRFMAENWESDVKHALYENRIPVIIKHSIMFQPASRSHMAILA
jgi:hypothetical protein